MICFCGEPACLWPDHVLSTDRILRKFMKREERASMRMASRPKGEGAPSGGVSHPGRGSGGLKGPQRA